MLQTYEIKSRIEDFISICETNISKNCEYKYEKEEMENYKEKGKYEIIITAYTTNSIKTKRTYLIVEEKDDKENTENDNNQNQEEKQEVNNTEINKKEEYKNTTVEKPKQNNNEKTTTTTTKKVQQNNQKNTTNPTTTTAKYIVNNTVEQTNEISYKYGVTINNTISNYYDIYSDGSKVLTNTTNDISYDYSTFNASTWELQGEAQSLVSSNSSTINAVLSYVNSYRKEVGTADIMQDYNLNVAATIRALEMGWSRNFSHTRPNGSSCFILPHLRPSVSC